MGYVCTFLLNDSFKNILTCRMIKKSSSVRQIFKNWLSVAFADFCGIKLPTLCDFKVLVELAREACDRISGDSCNTPLVLCDFT